MSVRLIDRGKKRHRHLRPAEGFFASADCSNGYKAERAAGAFSQDHLRFFRGYDSLVF
jgi:hypothetical protein